MTDYSDLGNLREIYLEDSYVRAIEHAPNKMAFRLEAVLTPESPRYRAPRSGEQYCYARGCLEFSAVTSVEWRLRNYVRSVDADGEEDLGNIDSLIPEDGGYYLEGGGQVVVYSTEQPLFSYDPSPILQGDSREGVS